HVIVLEFLQCADRSLRSSDALKRCSPAWRRPAESARSARLNTASASRVRAGGSRTHTPKYEVTAPPSAAPVRKPTHALAGRNARRRWVSHGPCASGRGARSLDGPEQLTGVAAKPGMRTVKHNVFLSHLTNGSCLEGSKPHTASWPAARAGQTEGATLGFLLRFFPVP